MFTFKNVGKEMCFWARFFLTIMTVIWMISVCLGAVLLYMLLDEMGFGEMIPGGTVIIPVVGGILTFLIGYAVIRLSTIRLYAQGKTVEHLASIDSKLDALRAAQNDPVPVSQPYFEPATPVHETVIEEPVPAAAPVETTPAPAAVAKGFCMNCGAENPDGSLFCTNCGASLS